MLFTSWEYNYLTIICTTNTYIIYIYTFFTFRKYVISKKNSSNMWDCYLDINYLKYSCKVGGSKLKITGCLIMIKTCHCIAHKSTDTTYIFTIELNPIFKFNLKCPQTAIQLIYVQHSRWNWINAFLVSKQHYGKVFVDVHEVDICWIPIHTLLASWWNGILFQVI